MSGAWATDADSVEWLDQPVNPGCAEQQPPVPPAPGTPGERRAGVAAAATVAD
ncbi:hypothetical protein BZL29_8183 [Mycobacterium kansasii]|uniref:Uncharacterized protein n=1 Tax=Mycobacterium kansasii TaxID=1768 RepID=A0A1V3WDL0_MYCKA|nr:hypothetical protein BZL29_8183 [Mycobacterium kansasii]